ADKEASTAEQVERKWPYGLGEKTLSPLQNGGRLLTIEPLASPWPWEAQSRARVLARSWAPGLSLAGLGWAGGFQARGASSRPGGPRLLRPRSPCVSGGPRSRRPGMPWLGFTAARGLPRLCLAGRAGTHRAETARPREAEPDLSPADGRALGSPAPPVGANALFIPPGPAQTEWGSGGRPLCAALVGSGSRDER
ncbi:hypothetical protein P7K49_034010, partial [Saguinus oedipus]